MKQLFAIFLTVSGVLCAQNNTLSIDDLDDLKGNWTGSLTYLDYNSGEPFTMPCNVTITDTKQANKLQISYNYPKEPAANSKSKITLSKDGRAINKKPIVAINRKDNGLKEVYCEYEGRDGNDNKEATIRTYYTIGKKEFKIAKFIKFKGTDEWIKRNEFAFNKAQ